MHILHIYKDYYPVLGGIENHVRVLAEAGAARGHTISVLVTSLDRNASLENMNGVELIKTPRWINISSTPISPALFGRARAIGREADIVHLHFPYPLGELAHLYSGSRAKTIITYHSDIVRQRLLRSFYRPWLWRILRRADRIIATSGRYLDTSLYISRFKDKSVVIPLGTQVELFAQADPDKTAELRRRLIQHSTEQLLLSVGRLRYYKGFGDLIQALPSIPNARYVIVGSGPMQTEWERLARSVGVSDRVVFAAEVPDAELPLYYAAADLFVLPANARAEAFGTVIVEAMAAGRAVVTTEVGTGTSWVNRAGETGLVVPPHDPAALAAAINRLLTDPDQRRAMGQAAQARARAEFTIEQMIERVFDVYDSLLKG
jgi:glycosyltransferase involved in cell wall biosynthesis